MTTASEPGRAAPRRVGPPPCWSCGSLSTRHVGPPLLAPMCDRCSTFDARWAAVLLGSVLLLTALPAWGDSVFLVVRNAVLALVLWEVGRLIWQAFSEPIKAKRTQA